MEDVSLVHIAERNLLGEVDAALLRGDAIEQVNERHHTPLLAAVLAGHADMTALLLERAANPNGCKRVSNGDTPLHVAARTGHAKLLELLLWHGAAVVRTPCTCGRRNTNHYGRESAGQHRRLWPSPHNSPGGSQACKERTPQSLPPGARPHGLAAHSRSAGEARGACTRAGHRETTLSLGRAAAVIEAAERSCRRR